MSREFLVSSGNTPKLFELVEEALNQIARFVTVSVIFTQRYAIGSRGDDRFSACSLDPLNQRIAVIAFIRKHSLRVRCFFKQFSHLSNVCLLRAGQGKPDGIAEDINDAVYFGSKSAARTTQSLRAVFFLTPAACWWARIAMLSSMTSSKSRSWLSTSDRRFQTPFLVQRANRVTVECQFPSSEGKSRHGAPVRPIHNTASINKRLSRAVTPQSLAFPGSKGAIRAHCASRSTKRFIIPTPSASWFNSLTLIVNTA